MAVLKMSQKEDIWEGQKRIISKLEERLTKARLSTSERDKLNTQILRCRKEIKNASFTFVENDIDGCGRVYFEHTGIVDKYAPELAFNESARISEKDAYSFFVKNRKQLSKDIKKYVSSLPEKKYKK
jgi:hypothetical protein